MSVYIGNQEVGLGVWEKPEYLQKPYTGFKMKAQLNGNQLQNVGLIHYGNGQDIQTPSLLYSMDNGTNWLPYTNGSWITLSQSNNTVCFMATASGNTSFSSQTDNSGWRFAEQSMSGTRYQVKLCGNIMSLLSQDYEGATSVPDYAFKELFMDTNYATEHFYIDEWDDPLRLPATSVGNSAYYSMFKSQYYLEYMPDLPATSVGRYAYRTMFNLVSFNECDLSNKCLPCLNPDINSYFDMFTGSNLAKSPIVLCNDTGYSCSSMFYGCNNLTSAYFPNASASVTLSSNTFYDCSNLKYLEIGDLDGYLNISSSSGVVVEKYDRGGGTTPSYLPSGWDYVCSTTGEVIIHND